MIASFRNRLWPQYKTGAGIEGALLAQFHPLEEALAAMGVVVWPMIELEADDALASAAHIACEDKQVEKVGIWTPDKDLGQCVRDTRVVQIDGRRKTIRDATGIREKFGVDPPLIPDLLALVGDAADGYPGIPRFGGKTAAHVLNLYGPIESFPPHIVGEHRDLALLFKNLATPAHRCATLRQRGDAALARCNARVCVVGGANRRSRTDRAVRKGCWPLMVTSTSSLRSKHVLASGD